jgi:general stress protein 26
VTDPREAREQLWELIKDIRFAMFTARHSNGHLHSRPMTLQNGKLDEDHSLWFFMSRSTDAVDDLRENPEVNVTFSDTGKDSYVSVSGHAHVVEDMAKKEQLFGPMAKAWYPKGPTDPDLVLVQVAIEHADFWDTKANKVTQLLKMAKAAVTGELPQNLGDHGVVRMS